MSKDIIYREDAIKAVAEVLSLNRFASFKNIKDFGRFAERMLRNVPSADRPTEVIYGNEHNCIMTIFGECSYAETGCGDCAVVEKVRKALSADRPQGEWVEQEDDYHHYWECSECGMGVGLDDIRNYCPNCGAKMKGADDE